MKLILIRHAESLRNIKREGRAFYNTVEEKIGLPNHLIPITEKGREQAEDVALTLYESLGKGKGSFPAIIFHSGFVRTHETATILYAKLKKLAKEDGVEIEIPFEQNHLLRERDAGHTFEMTSDEAKENFPHLEDYWKLDGKWFAVPIGGESIIQVMDRVSIFLNQITQRPSLNDLTVYAITHGGTMMAFEMVIKKIPFEKATELVRGPKNCDTREYQYNNGVWSAVS